MIVEPQSVFSSCTVYGFGTVALVQPTVYYLKSRDTVKTCSGKEKRIVYFIHLLFRFLKMKHFSSFFPCQIFSISFAPKQFQQFISNTERVHIYLYFQSFCFFSCILFCSFWFYSKPYSEKC